MNENEKVLDAENLQTEEVVQSENENVSSGAGEEVLRTWEGELLELENTLATQAAKISADLEKRSEQLDKREAELNLRKNFIDDCESKLTSLEAEEKNFQFRQKELDELEKKLQDSAVKLEEDYKKRLEKLEQDFQNKSNLCAEKITALDEREATLIQRENDIKAKEISLENDLNARKNQVEQEILEQKQRNFEELATQLSEERKKHGETVAERFQQEEQHYLEEFAKATQKFKDAFETQRQAAMQAVEEEERKRLKYVEERENNVEQKEAEQLQRDRDLQRRERHIEAQERSLEITQENIDQEVEERYHSEISKLNDQLKDKDFLYSRLVSDFSNMRQEINKLQAIKDSFGERPFDAISKELNELKSENQKLKNEILALPPADVAEKLETKSLECDKLQIEIANLRRDRTNLSESASHSDELESKLRIAENKIGVQQFEIEELTKTNENLLSRIKRLQADEGRIAEREERIKSIETRLPGVNAPASAESDIAPTINEMNWLEEIGKNCYRYGFKFPRRIFYAFHTALKIADWSTITVLAGVSGTGKSALPQLYSKFGGLNFISAAVQPNWDSQESMLGFFNSIDNKFDAQPLLRFLAQCSSGKDGMDKSLNIVLLDEMNLAHVEHYFAEFLSKLESRRNSESEFVEINIGAGIEPYHLQLTRNILWAGTMNQDETTKSLSDKVLDRGLVINFPRPKNLFGRSKLQKIDDFTAENKIQLLDYRVWNEQWLKKEINLSDKQEKILLRYRDEVFQKINDFLSVAGRALGHRVWQSVEFYTINYPEVIVALEEAGDDVTDKLEVAIKTAVEDQIVQKVMPKLRGIETRGPVSENCLKKIRALLLEESFNLDDDFDRAEKMGYGQFMWNSAEYVDDSDIIGAERNGLND